MRTLFLLPLVPFFLISCGKEFLDIKQNKSQVVPATISDFQSMLDDWQSFNRASSNQLGIIGADEFYISDAHWNLLAQPYQKNAYIWADEIYEGNDVEDWNTAYHRILLANMVLEGIDRVNPQPRELEDWGQVKGGALFFRAWNYYQLAQLFCKPYDARTASVDPGIPLRLESDVTVKLGRGTVEGVYRQIIQDLDEAGALLPAVVSNKMQPSKPAAYALLARVCLVMGDYPKAEEYADLCLQLKKELVDFNRINRWSNDLFPLDFGATNPEVLFFCYMNNIEIVSISRFHADTNLLASYAEGDLRMEGYFRDIGGGRKIFKGSYSNNLGFFTGLATDEIYLVRAESAARQDDFATALHHLNTLLENRYDAQSFIPVGMDSKEMLLTRILAERSKELVLRGTRWEDLRRLKQVPELAKTVVREIGGTRYELPPNSPRWVWPIPLNEIDVGKLEQNER